MCFYWYAAHEDMRGPVFKWHAVTGMLSSEVDQCVAVGVRTHIWPVCHCVNASQRTVNRISMGTQCVCTGTLQRE